MSATENLKEVLNNIRAIESRAGRKPGSVKLIAVSKTYPVEVIREVVQSGQLDLGENKVQEMCSKQPELPGAVWHLIGHLQSNKVKYIAPFVHLIHSVDSEKLLQVIQQEAAKQNRTIGVLLQIFISGEDTKSGMSFEEAKVLLSEANRFPNITFHGLMGMAALTEDRALIREQFRSLKSGFEILRNHFPALPHFSEISMGMSGDYDIAIEEGATLVRIGSAIFGKRQSQV